MCVYTTLCATIGTALLACCIDKKNAAKNGVCKSKPLLGFSLRAPHLFAFALAFLSFLLSNFIHFSSISFATHANVCACVCVDEIAYAVEVKSTSSTPLFYCYYTLCYYIQMFQNILYIQSKIHL